MGQLPYYQPKESVAFDYMQCFQAEMGNVTNIQYSSFKKSNPAIEKFVTQLTEPIKWTEFDRKTETKKAVNNLKAVMTDKSIIVIIDIREINEGGNKYLQMYFQLLPIFQTDQGIW